MCSTNHSTLYVGVTSNIASRVYEHKHKIYPTSFSAKYNCIKLVYYRRFELIIEAIAEEKHPEGKDALELQNRLIGEAIKIHNLHSRKK